MQAFDVTDIPEWCQENGGIGVSDEWKIQDNPALVHADILWYPEDANGDIRSTLVIDACLEVMGTWDECLLWITEAGVFPSHENWPAYYALRGEDGELMSLWDKPGHQFTWKERGRFCRYLETVVNNLWDALILPATHGQPESLRLKTSHHACVDLWSRTPRAFATVRSETET